MTTNTTTKAEIRTKLSDLLSRFQGPYSRQPKFEHYGRTIVCRLQSAVDGTNDIAPFGVAVCHDEDKFDPETGKLIALRRAMGEDFEARAYGLQR